MTISNTTLATYQADVLDAPGLVLVGFVLDGQVTTSIEGCLQAVVDTFAGAVTAVKVDCATEEQLLIDTEVNQVPMILFYKNGVKVHAMRGFQMVSSVERMVNVHIGNS